MILVPLAIMGQTITGKVVDTDGAPLELANVVLLNSTDSTFVCGTVTLPTGEFTIEQTKGTDGILRFTSIGYKTYYINHFTNNVGIIQMQPEAKILGEVVIKGSIPKAKLNGASLIIDVENTILSKMGTGDNVLSHTPTIIKRKDGYEVLGKGSPLIYINGKKVRDNFEITNLQANQIKSIEVVQNPGARYDATVNSVIIIRTKKRVGEGLGVTVGTTNLKGKGFQNEDFLNLTYGKGGLEVFANLYGYYWKTHAKNSYEEGVTASNLWSINHDGTLFSRQNYIYGKIGFSYQIDKHSFGASYSNSTGLIKSYTESTDVTYEDANINEKLNSNSLHRSKLMPNHNANIYYNGVIGKASIDFNMDLLDSKLDNKALTQETSTLNENRDVNTDAENKSQLVAEKLVISHPIWKGKLTWGEELTFTKRKEKYTNSEELIPSSDTEVKESTIAPFIELSQTLGKWGLQLGLRYEHNISNYYACQVKQNDLCRIYNNFFPFISASTTFRKVQMSLSYSAKTIRPYYGQLSEIVNYENRYRYSTGNNLLKPTSRHTVNFMILWKDWGFYADYKYLRNTIQEYYESYQENPKIVLSKVENYDHRNDIHLSIGWNPTFGIWNPSYYISLDMQWFKVYQNNNNYQKFNSPIGQLSCNNAFNLPKGWFANIDYFLQTKGHAGIYYMNNINHYLNLSLSKSFFSNKLYVQLSANDVFGTDRNYRVVDSNNYHISYRDNSFSRNVSLTVRYSFNTANSKYKGRGAGNAEKQRL